jgi:hypothetical protein
MGLSEGRRAILHNALTAILLILQGGEVRMLAVSREFQAAQSLVL